MCTDGRNLLATCRKCSSTLIQRALHFASPYQWQQHNFFKTLKLHYIPALYQNACVQKIQIQLRSNCKVPSEPPFISKVRICSFLGCRIFVLLWTIHSSCRVPIGKCIPCSLWWPFNCNLFCHLTIILWNKYTGSNVLIRVFYTQWHHFASIEHSKIHLPTVPGASPCNLAFSLLLSLMRDNCSLMLSNS